ncbi:hypothetical protein GEMRC1_010388 [Eukaryota sp. GEM-RC1]
MDFQCQCCNLSAIQTPKTVVLASTSPRRQALFRHLFQHFEIVPSLFDESSVSLSDPKDLVEKLSYFKALSVVNTNLAEIKDKIVVASDTVVVLDNQILGKPADVPAALQMLSSLSGKKHSVLSGVTIYYVSPCGKHSHVTYSAESFVTFNQLSQEQLTEYVESGEAFDKAGGYGIQTNLGSKLVCSHEGCYLNIVGFPVSSFRTRLALFIEEVVGKN